MSSKRKILHKHNGQERQAIKFIMVKLKNTEVSEGCSNQEFKAGIF